MLCSYEDIGLCNNFHSFKYEGSCLFFQFYFNFKTKFITFYIAHLSTTLTLCILLFISVASVIIYSDGFKFFKAVFILSRHCSKCVAKPENMLNMFMIQSVIKYEGALLKLFKKKINDKIVIISLRTTDCFFSFFFNFFFERTQF